MRGESMDTTITRLHVLHLEAAKAIFVLQIEIIVVAVAVAALLWRMAVGP